MPSYPDDLARMRRALKKDDFGATRGNVLPMQKTASGDIEAAWPEFVRQAGVGLIDLLAGTTTGQVTPEAFGTLMDVAGGGAASAPARTAGLGMLGGKLARPELSMDEASRMTRARESGFDPNDRWLHGTADDFEAFDTAKAGARSGSEGQDAVFLTKDPHAAGRFAEVAGAREPLPGEKPHDVFMPGTQSEVSFVYEGSNVMPLLHRAQNVKAVDAPFYNTREFDAIIADARKSGHDAVLFRGVKSEGGDQLAVLDPALLRSRFAAFDPAKRESDDLLAARVGGAPLPSAQSQDSNRGAKADSLADVIVNRSRKQDRRRP